MLSGRYAWVTVSLVLTGAAVAAGLGVVPSQATTTLAGARAQGSFSPSSTKFVDQTLTWKACLTRSDEPGLPRTYYRLQCTNVTVPLDWAAPDGPTITMAVARLRTTHRPAKGVLFTNPGGPGASGSQLPLVLVDAQQTTLLNSQDIYGIDTRGSGDSDNTTCGSPTEVGTDPADRSDANVNLLLDSAALIARACDVAGGDLIDHVDTAQTVRDLELLRVLIDAPKINWLGYSAGTWLGAMYSALYPDRVGHMVFDSTVDFTGTWQDAFEAQPAGFQRRFTDDFLPWVAKYDSTFHLGTTASAVMASYVGVRAGLDPRRPVESPNDLDQLIAGSMYSKYLFPLAAEVLSELSDSVYPVALTAHVSQLRRETYAPWSTDAEDAAFLAVTCNDTPYQGGRAGVVNASGRLGLEYPLIGWSTINEPCAFWNRPATQLPLPIPRGAGVPPTLFVQATHDPATPLEGAEHAAAGFAGSRMLMVTNEGDHTIYAGGNRCVDSAVEKFILVGTLPRAGATCPGQPMPDPSGIDPSGLGLLSSASTGSRSGMNPLQDLKRQPALH